MKLFGIAGVFAVLGAVALPVSANTLPARVAPDIKFDVAAQTDLGAISPVVEGELSVTAEETLTEEIQATPVIIEEQTPEPTTSNDSLEAIRRNNIKQKLEALYSENIETAVQATAKVETPRKETGIKGFFKTIIKLFE